MKKKKVLQKEDIGKIKRALDKLFIFNLTPELVFHLFKIQFLSQKFLDFIRTRDQIEYNYENESDQGQVNEFIQDEYKYLACLDALLGQADIEIAKFFLKKLRKRDRMKVIETYSLNPMETYIYSFIKKRMQNKQRIDKKLLLEYITKYKKYRITNEKYFDALANRIKNRVKKQLYRERQKNNSLSK
jgi:hypothetical protein